MIDNLRVWFQDMYPMDPTNEGQIPMGQGGAMSGYGWGANFTPTPQSGGMGNAGFYIPSKYPQQGAPTAGGYSPTAQGIQNFYQGQGQMQQYPGQMPQGLPQISPGAYDPSQFNYLAQGGLNQQRYSQGQSGISQGIQNLQNLLKGEGIPTGMEGARTVADIAAGAASEDSKTRQKDALSALQGQRGTGAGLGSNIDQLMSTAMGIESQAARSTYANALVGYLQNQIQALTSGARTLSPM
jgi:hypothetical protein